jgi:hypothetical protein
MLRLLSAAALALVISAPAHASTWYVAMKTMHCEVSPVSPADMARHLDNALGEMHEMDDNEVVVTGKMNGVAANMAFFRTQVACDAFLDRMRQKAAKYE